MARKQAQQTSAPLPYDQSAEAQVVGRALLDSSVVAEVGLVPEQFYDTRLGTAYRSIMGYFQSHLPIDDNVISTNSGLSTTELGNLRAGVIQQGDFQSHAAKIVDNSMKRKLIGLASVLNRDASDVNKTASEVMQDIASRLTGMLMDGERSIVELVGTTVSMSSSPRYKVILRVHGEDKEIVFLADDLLNRELFKKKVLEHFHDNPILPDKAEWDIFVCRILKDAKREIAPDDTSEEAMLAFYLREWKRSAAYAESPLELVRGYVEKDGFIYFLSERVRAWIAAASKLPLASMALWLNVQRWGGHKKAIRVTNEDGSTRYMWGLPKSFFEQEFTERLESIDLSFLSE